MQQRCLKRCIGVQFVVAVGLITAIVIAYFVQKSARENKTGSPALDNGTAPFYDSEKYTAADDRSPIGKEADDVFISTSEIQATKDDDFITTLDLPEWSQDMSSRFDNETSEFENDIFSDIDDDDFSDFSDDDAALQDDIGEATKRERPTNVKTTKNQKSDKASVAPSPYRSLRPSSMPSYRPSVYYSVVPGDGPSLASSDISEAMLEPTADTVNSQQPTSAFDALITTFVEDLIGEAAVSDNEINCPLTHEYSAACSDEMVGRECFYDYAYTGCVWNSLSCSPMVECKCENLLGPGLGRWSCKENRLPSCALRRRTGLPPLGKSCNPEEPLPANSLDSSLSSVVISTPLKPSMEEAENSIESPSTTPTESTELFTESPSTNPSMAVELTNEYPSTNPTEATGSLTELPSTNPSMVVELTTENPSTNPTEATQLSSECPLDPMYGECSGYQDDLHCDYAYIYKGCTWDVLQCSPAIQCDCSEGSWKCKVDFTTPCENAVNGHPPGGLPWGEECDPSVPPVIPEKAEKKTECPSNLAFGSCFDYEEDLRCEYNHAYKGCTWDEFQCAPSIMCDCRQNTWQCSGDFENPCELEDGSSSIMDDLPWGKACDPLDDEELKEFLRSKIEPPTSAPTKAPTPAELSDECPTTFRYGECKQQYLDNLQCPYNYAYKGCSWEELSCEPSVECKCDHWIGHWQCKSSFENCDENGLSVLPEGLPWGEACDPTEKLPTPPPSTQF